MRRNKRVLANLAFFTFLFVVMVGWAVELVVSVDQIDKPYNLAAEFANAFGVAAQRRGHLPGRAPTAASRGVERVPGGVVVA